MCFFNCLSPNLLTMFFLASEYPTLPGISSVSPVRPLAQTQDPPEQPQRQCRPHPHTPLLAISKPNSMIPGHCSQTTMRESERWRESSLSMILLGGKFATVEAVGGEDECGSELVGVGAASDNDDHARTIEYEIHNDFKLIYTRKVRFP